MNDDLKREQRLHKIVAASGFLFALCILPLAQYILNHSTQDTPSNTGTVAGVSTDKSITQGDAAQSTDPAACEAQKQTDQNNLTIFYNGKKQALLSSYLTAIQPYESAGTDPNQNAANAQNLKAQYDAYTQSLTQVQNAVNQAQNAIVTRNCGDASPSPVAS